MNKSMNKYSNSSGVLRLLMALALTGFVFGCGGGGGVGGGGGGVAPPALGTPENPFLGFGPTGGVCTGAACVSLGTAANYVILAKTGVSTVPPSVVTGNVGLSPAAASFITGFSLRTPVVIDAAGNFSTSAQVTGKVYAADYNEPPNPTPADLTTAVLNMQAAYDDAAGRPTGLGLLDRFGGDLTGQTLTPGVYTWGTGVLINAPGVTLSGPATGVWIFQIAQTLTVGNGAIVTLSGGALAQNVFWQVADVAALGTTVQFKGIILGQTAITLNTGATINGRALAQTAVTLDASTVTQP